MNETYDYIKIRRVNPTLREVITLEDFKDSLNFPIEDESQDIFLQNLLTAARYQAENYCGRFFAPYENVQIIFKRTQNKVIELPIDTSEIISVYADNVEITDSNYSYDTDLCELTVNSLYSNLKISVKSGAVDPVATRAILMLAADMFEDRTGDLIQENKAAKAMLTTLKTGWRF